MTSEVKELPYVTELSKSHAKDMRTASRRIRRMQRQMRMLLSSSCSIPQVICEETRNSQKYTIKEELSGIMTITTTTTSELSATLGQVVEVLRKSEKQNVYRRATVVVPMECDDNVFVDSFLLPFYIWFAGISKITCGDHGPCT